MSNQRLYALTSTLIVLALIIIQNTTSIMLKIHLKSSLIHGKRTFFYPDLVPTSFGTCIYKSINFLCIYLNKKCISALDVSPKIYKQILICISHAVIQNNPWEMMFYVCKAGFWNRFESQLVLALWPRDSVFVKFQENSINVFC